MKAYFVFLRYLVFLNLLHCALISGFILGPTAFYGSSGESAVMKDYSKLTTSQSRLPQLFCVILCDFTAHLKFGANDSVLDFFLGTVGGLYTCMCMCVFYVLLLQCTFPPPLCRATWIVLQSSSVSILVVL